MPDLSGEAGPLAGRKQRAIRAKGKKEAQSSKVKGRGQKKLKKPGKSVERENTEYGEEIKKL
ncbi:MAG: hypothetical protein NT009_13630 [Proteobacteria bacterium]|nr:hypothetical protein [Pseudomonadota bacterium]